MLPIFDENSDHTLKIRIRNYDTIYNNIINPSDANHAGDAFVSFEQRRQTMSFEVWLAFSAVALLNIISPGPAILLAISNGVTSGLKHRFSQYAKSP